MDTRDLLLKIEILEAENDRLFKSVVRCRRRINELSKILKRVGKEAEEDRIRMIDVSNQLMVEKRNNIKINKIKPNYRVAM